MSLRSFLLLQRTQGVRCQWGSALILAGAVLLFGSSAAMEAQVPKADDQSHIEERKAATGVAVSDRQALISLTSAIISFLSVCTALTALYFARQDRREQQVVAGADARRREQQSLLDALKGEKEAVAFMGLELSRNPDLMTPDNKDRLLSALCLAFVFQSSSRARAFALRALRRFSQEGEKEKICAILSEIAGTFDAYEEGLEVRQLEEYQQWLTRLRLLLECGI